MGMTRLAALTALAFVVLACGSSSSSSSSSSSGGSSGTPSGDDAGDDAGDAGTTPGDAGKKELASPCANDAECASGHCFLGGTETYCTDTCTKKGKDDPTCQDLGAFFTGKCSLAGLCLK